MPTNIVSRASVLGLKVETTEGTPVAPGATTDFIALQGDFSMEPGNQSLENEEIRNSIGVAQPILGAEEPTAALSHYLRHSGVEGQAPNYKALLKALWGTETVAGAEYDCEASSTVAIVKTATASTNFARGQGILVKDATNGYSIRVAHSLTSTDLIPSFNLPGAPAENTTLGKCAFYSPASTGHQTLTLWHYLGNAGAVQFMSGSRVTEMSVAFNAGELINASYSLEGVAYYFNGMEITSSTRYIDWTDDDGTWAAAITARWYKDPHEVASALETAMNAASTETITVTYSDTTGKFTITASGTVLTLKWNTGANTANTIGTKIGFSVAADDSGTAAGTGYTSDNALSFAASYTPAYDTAPPLAAKNNEVLFGDQTSYVSLEASEVTWTTSLGRRPIESVAAESGIAGSIISSRETVITVRALLNQYDAQKYRRFRAGTTTRFQYNFGTKTGGNWDAGKCGYLYAPDCTISSFRVVDDDGLVTLEMELRPFVDSTGNGEVYLGFV
jgi:hypothetical protein